MAIAEMNDTQNDLVEQRKRRNLVLFGVHVALALGLLALFVYSVVHR